MGADLKLLSFVFLLMKILKISTNTPLPEDAISVRKDLVKSEEEIKLAHHLAELSFKSKKNIAKKFKYEFLLWLTGKTDIKSALRISEPKQKECIAVVFGDSTVKGKAHNLKRTAEPLDIEKISLSRIK